MKEEAGREEAGREEAKEGGLPLLPPSSAALLIGPPFSSLTKRSLWDIPSTIGGKDIEESRGKTLPWFQKLLAYPPCSSLSVSSYWEKDRNLWDLEAPKGRRKS